MNILCAISTFLNYKLKIVENNQAINEYCVGPKNIISMLMHYLIQY
ncbi:hypothetical protein H375_9090 [Rickettsia prowazekii str. Breinl]|nr:hypothetical protein H375_9090 [Rickettsia prowazekii str. Breinl]